MTANTYWRRPRGLASFFACLLASAPGWATQPMTDFYTDGARKGRIFPAACCYVELPSNERIWELRRRERCSAIGGPVGMFRLEDGKLWLTGLSKCSGDMPLKEVYPALDGPVVAEWLTGTFTTVLDSRCYAGAQTVYAVRQELIVEKGVVKSLNETPGDTSACAK